MRMGPSMPLLGALLGAGLTATSAFVSTTPVVSSRLSSRQQHQPCSSSSGRTTPATANSRRRTATTAMLFGGGGVGGEGLTELGSMVSGAVGQAHASAMGSGLGTFLLLADDPPAPPNIYGEVAQGGFFIIFSGVFSAYIIATMIRTMPIDQLEKLTAELGGGNEIADLEAQRIETTKRFKELTKDMAQAADPTMGVKPDDALSERLSQQTRKALQTDIASIEDEYGD
ncbi:unnamed protein product [Ectocarpus sp. 12 AP-2014]